MFIIIRDRNVIAKIVAIFQNASPHVTTVLAGNKCESPDRVVDTDSGKKVIKKYT